MTETTQPGGGVSEERRAQLLKRARLSRLQWVLQGRETTSSSSESSSSREKGLPGLETMQDILQFLNELSSSRPANKEHDAREHCDRDLAASEDQDDALAIDLDSLLLSLPLSAETEDEIDSIVREFAARSGSLSPYELFLQRLLHPAAAAVVKALQQFVVKFTIAMRRANMQQHYSLPTEDQKNSTGSANNSGFSFPLRSFFPP